MYIHIHPQFLYFFMVTLATALHSPRTPTARGKAEKSAKKTEGKPRNGRKERGKNERKNRTFTFLNVVGLDRLQLCTYHVNCTKMVWYLKNSVLEKNFVAYNLSVLLCSPHFNRHSPLSSMVAVMILLTLSHILLPFFTFPCERKGSDV